MLKVFRKYVYWMIGAASAVILLFTYVLEGRDTLREQKQTFQVKLDQIERTMEENKVELDNLRESLDEDYLTRANAFAYIIEKDPDVLKDPGELRRLEKLLDVDELHVSDEKGVIAYSSVPKYIGLDFHSGEQMQGFLPILESGSKYTYVVQEAQPNTAEGKIMQYVGVSRQDKKGIVQVGLKPVRLLEAQERHTYSYLFSRMPTDIGETLFALDISNGTFLGHTDRWEEGEVLRNAGSSLDTLLTCEDGRFLTLDGTKQFVMTRKYGDVLLCAAVSRNILYQNRGRSVLMLFGCLLLLGLAGVAVMDRMLRLKIAAKVNVLLRDLKEINRGNPDIEIETSDIPEFAELGREIGKLKEEKWGAARKVSHLIELSRMPMAAFECRMDAGRVLCSSRLQELLRLSDQELEEMLPDPELFLKHIRRRMHNPVEGEPDVYLQPDGAYLRIRLSSEQSSCFGILCDLSEFRNGKEMNDGMQEASEETAAAERKE